MYDIFEFQNTSRQLGIIPEPATAMSPAAETGMAMANVGLGLLGAFGRESNNSRLKVESSHSLMSNFRSETTTTTGGHSSHSTSHRMNKRMFIKMNFINDTDKIHFILIILKLLHTESVEMFFLVCV